MHYINTRSDLVYIILTMISAHLITIISLYQSIGEVLCGVSEIEALRQMECYVMILGVREPFYILQPDSTGTREATQTHYYMTCRRTSGLYNLYIFEISINESR